MNLLTVLRVGCVLALLAFSVLALLPQQYLQSAVFDWWDKAQHALAFAVLTALALLAWPQERWRVVWLLLVYGGLIEWAQWVTGWRHGEWVDWLADATGIALAWGVVVIGHRCQSRRVQGH